MKELLLLGKDLLIEYSGKGTEIFIAFFSLCFLVFLYYIKKSKELNEKIANFTKINTVLFILMVFPFISDFFLKINSTDDRTYLFQMIPTSLLFGVAAVMLHNLLPEKKKKLPITLFVCVIILLSGMTSPWKLTADNYHLTTNKYKISSDLLEIQKTVGSGRVLLPKRLYAQQYECPSDLTTPDLSYETLDETDSEELVKIGLENDCQYVILDRKKVSGDDYKNLENIVSEYNYRVEFDESRYIYLKQNTTWEVTQHSDSSGSQGLFFTLYNREDHTLILIDGGHSENEEYVRSVINQYGGVVDAWFLTHFHEDHIGAFNEIYEEPNNITIKEIYASSYEFHYSSFLKNHKDWDDPETFAKYKKITKNADNIYHPARGEDIAISNITVRNYNTYDKIMLRKEKEDIPNNCGLVLRFQFTKDSILFMGDMYSASIGQYLINKYGEEIKSEYISAAHHGNSKMPTSFYEYVSPSVMFFDGPEWLVTSDKYKAKALMQWCDSLEIEHYDHRTSPNKFYFW